MNEGLIFQLEQSKVLHFFLELFGSVTISACDPIVQSSEILVLYLADSSPIDVGVATGLVSAHFMTSKLRLEGVVACKSVERILKL